MLVKLMYYTLSKPTSISEPWLSETMPTATPQNKRAKAIVKTLSEKTAALFIGHVSSQPSAVTAPIDDFGRLLTLTGNPPLLNSLPLLILSAL